MNGRPFSFEDFEAIFGPECTEIVKRNVREAPPFTPEQILRGRQIFATFPLPHRRPANGVSSASDANADDASPGPA